MEEHHSSEDTEEKSITEMKRKKARNKTTCRGRREKGRRGVRPGHQQPSQVKKVHVIRTRLLLLLGKALSVKVS